MKKMIAFLLALSMLLCFVGCGKDEPETAAPAAPAVDGWSFDYNGTEIAISATKYVLTTSERKILLRLPVKVENTRP